MSELTDAKIECPFDFDKKKTSKYEAAYYEVKYCNESCPFFVWYKNGHVGCQKRDLETLETDIKDIEKRTVRIIELVEDLIKNNENAGEILDSIKGLKEFFGYDENDGEENTDGTDE